MTWAVVAILLGILLLGLEIFVPSGGLLLILALFFICTGVVVIFYTPTSEGGGTTVGVITIVGLLVFLPLMTAVLFHYWQSSPMGKAVFLSQPTEEEAAVITEAQVAYQTLHGQVGRTATQHQPSGAVDIQGRRYDSTTEGMFLAAGQFVRVVGVTGSQLVVRPVTQQEISELPADLNA